MSNGSNVGHLEDEALKRKERLKMLKRGELTSLTRNETTNKESNEEETADLSEFPKPIFRNYNPKDDTLKPGVLPKPKLIEIENEIKEQLESGKPTLLIEKEIDLTTLAPQKIDWDLKRDCEKKLKILEKRTQRAIVDLIRDRLKQQKNSDLAELVSVGSRDNIKRNEARHQNKDEKKDSEEEEEDDEDEDEEDENDESNDSQENGNYSSETSNENDLSNDKFKETSPVVINDKREISDDDDY